MKQIALSFCALALSALALPATAATLLGDTIGCSVEPTVTFGCTNPTAVVASGAGSGNEFEILFGSNPGVERRKVFDVNVSGSSVFFEFDNPIFQFGSVRGGTLTLTDLDFDDNSIVTGIANFEETVYLGTDINDVTFGADWISIAIGRGVFRGPGEYISFDIVTAPIPLPAGLPLLLAALGPFAALRRRA